VASRDDQTVMRRKLAVAAANVAQGGPGADRSWRVVLARAARDSMTLGLEVTRLDQSRASLTELLDMPPDRALIAVLEGPGEGLGLLAISAPLLAAMTEMQTIGRVTALAPPPRKPTRTDAAMVAGFIDAALAGLELALADEADLVWAGGFRYASFLDDPRPLGLLLEDIPYRVLRAEISVESGVRLGQILMALPAAGRGQRPRTASHAMPEAVAGHVFAAELAEQVGSVPCVLQAVIHRMMCPLSTVIALQVGDMLAMGQASLDKIGLHGLDGLRVSEGRLGQNRGMCAVRLTQAQIAVPLVENGQDVIDLQRVAMG
jgi:flagellar motor switch protein FliM